jgi:hypothetical protein
VLIHSSTEETLRCQEFTVTVRKFGGAKPHTTRINMVAVFLSEKPQIHQCLWDYWDAILQHCMTPLRTHNTNLHISGRA